MYVAFPKSELFPTTHTQTTNTPDVPVQASHPSPTYTFRDQFRRLESKKSQNLSATMTSTLSSANTTSTPDKISDSERVKWVLIWYLGIGPAIWLTPIVYARLKKRTVTIFRPVAAYTF